MILASRVDFTLTETEPKRDRKILGFMVVSTSNWKANQLMERG